MSQVFTKCFDLDQYQDCEGRERQRAWEIDKETVKEKEIPWVGGGGGWQGITEHGNEIHFYVMITLKCTPACKTSKANSQGWSNRYSRCPDVESRGDAAAERDGRRMEWRPWARQKMKMRWDERDKERVNAEQGWFERDEGESEFCAESSTLTFRCKTALGWKARGFEVCY